MLRLLSFSSAHEKSTSHESSARARLDARERLVTATKAERVVKRFLSTPGWESGGQTLRQAYDNVKQDRLPRRSKCPLLAESRHLADYPLRACGESTAIARQLTHSCRSALLELFGGWYWGRTSDPCRVNLDLSYAARQTNTLRLPAPCSDDRKWPQKCTHSDAPL